MRTTFVVAVTLLVGVLSCGEQRVDTHDDTLTQRQRDSLIGTSQLPGAQGVRGALKASDSAAARRAHEDAAAEQP
jgi:hypothetical protein